MLFSEFSGKGAFITVDTEQEMIAVSSNGNKKEIKFSLTGFDRDLVKAGGWVDYVDKKY